jgi:hypothetical protein
VSAVGTLGAYVVLLALIGAFGYVLLLAINDAPEVVGSFVTALGAVIAVVAGRVWEKRQELEQVRRERIAPIYSRFVEVVYGSMSEETKLGETDLLAFFHDWAQQVLIWGPEPVIRRFTDWRATFSDDSEVQPESVFATEQLLYAIRDDLGNKRGGLGAGDLLRVFLNDIDEYLAEHRSAH